MPPWTSRKQEAVRRRCLVRPFLLLLVLSVLSSGANGSNGGIRGPPLSSHELHAQKIETIKSDILRKLGMAEKPKLNFSREGIPSALIDEFWHENTQQNEKVKQASKKVIFLGQNARLLPCQESSCLEVTFNEKSLHLEIASMDIWIYKERLKSGPDFISVHKSDDLNETLQLSTSDSSKSGWVVTHVDHDSDKWLVTNRHGQKTIKLKLRMSCKNCRFSVHKKDLPFLSVTHVDVPKRRGTRVVCSPATACCRFALYVDFAEIGWDFILSPKGFHAYYCLGNCTRKQALSTEHDHIVQILKPDVQSCCTPQKYGSLKLLYYDKDVKNAYLKDVQDIVALECGCV